MLPEKVLAKFRKILLSPDANIEFTYKSTDVFDRNVPAGIILDVTSKKNHIRLDRDDDFCLNFYHTSPGTGTRVATIDLSSISASPIIRFILKWTPYSAHLSAQSLATGSILVNATGVESKKKFRVGKDGHVYQIGDHRIDVMSVNIYSKGKPILQPTAIEAWSETLRAIDLLATGQSPEGYVYDTVVTNLSLVILVTGFESYTKRRFLELEQEEKNPDINVVINEFIPTRERDAGIIELLESEAVELNISMLEHIINRYNVNFQSYKVCKRVYNRAYNIKFGELYISSKTLEAIKGYIGHRHQIIHVSPFSSERSQTKGPNTTVHVKLETAKHHFQDFINQLHGATLAIRNNR